jgi:hypothetical protein
VEGQAGGGRIATGMRRCIRHCFELHCVTIDISRTRAGTVRMYRAVAKLGIHFHPVVKPCAPLTTNPSISSQQTVCLLTTNSLTNLQQTV